MKKKNKKKFEEAKRRNQERLLQAIKEKESKAKEMRMADINKELREQQEKLIKQQTTMKILKNAKTVTEKGPNVKQEISSLLYEKDYKETIDRYSPQIETLFSHYCKQAAAKSEQQSTQNLMSFNVYNKFCSQFRICPGLINGDEHQNVFNHLTKQKGFQTGVSAAITVEEFKTSLAHLTSNARVKLNQQASQGPNMLSAKTFGAFIRYLELDIPVKTLKNKLKKLAEEKRYKQDSIQDSAEVSVIEEFKEQPISFLVNSMTEDEKKAKLLEDEEAILKRVFESKGLTQPEEVLQEFTGEYNDPDF